MFCSLIGADFFVVVVDYAAVCACFDVDVGCRVLVNVECIVFVLLSFV